MTEAYTINGETIEWEVEEGEAVRFFANPLDFPPYIQKKYLGISADEFEFRDDETGEVPEGHEVRFITQKNPFTGEEREIRTFYDFREELETKKTKTLEELKQELDDIRQHITGGASPEEMSGWNVKASIAPKILDNTATLPEIEMEQVEADIVGITIEELAQKQIIKAQYLRNAIAVLDGLSKKAKMLIEEAETLEDLDIQLEVLRELKDEHLENIF